MLYEVITIDFTDPDTAEYTGQFILIPVKTLGDHIHASTDRKLPIPFFYKILWYLKVLMIRRI